MNPLPGASQRFALGLARRQFAGRRPTGWPGLHLLPAQLLAHLGAALLDRHPARIARNHRIEASYNGGYANLPMGKNLSPLPAKYWNFANSYSAATDNAMKATVANPFLAALPAIQASNPAL